MFHGAGVGATQSSCTARFGLWTCGRYLQFGWWGVWYSFFLLVAIAYMVSIQMPKAATDSRV